MKRLSKKGRHAKGEDNPPLVVNKLAPIKWYYDPNIPKGTGCINGRTRRGVIGVKNSDD